MASARFECKRQMHVHPHVFQFETTKPLFPPAGAWIRAVRTVFVSDSATFNVMTKCEGIAWPVLRCVIGGMEFCLFM